VDQRNERFGCLCMKANPGAGISTTVRLSVAIMAWPVWYRVEFFNQIFLHYPSTFY